jgi:hypothetical protein
MSETKDKLTQGVLSVFENIGKEVVASLQKPANDNAQKDVGAQKDADAKDGDPAVVADEKGDTKDTGITMDTFKDAMGEVVTSLKDYIDQKLETKEDRVAAKQQTVVESMKELLVEKGFDVENHEIAIDIRETKKSSGKTDTDSLNLKLNGSDNANETENEKNEGTPEEIEKQAKDAIWHSYLSGARKHKE